MEEQWQHTNTRYAYSTRRLDLSRRMIAVIQIADQIVHECMHTLRRGRHERRFVHRAAFGADPYRLLPQDPADGAVPRPCHETAVDVEYAL